jgi:Fe-S cluster assembly iron-binding protein IscA
MFEVSEGASEKIRKFLEEDEGLKFIRVLMTEGGWRGLYLVMALDEQKPDAEVFPIGGGLSRREGTF